MSDKPTHRWFQFHLSTAIVLMFVAGGLLWLNFRNYREHQPSDSNDAHHIGFPVEITYRDEAGTDFSFTFDGENEQLVQRWTCKLLRLPGFKKDETNVKVYYSSWDRDGVSLFVVPNALFALLVLAFSGLLAEIIARRRKIKN